MTNHGIKLPQEKFRLGIRKTFFTDMVVDSRNRVPREVVTASSLSEFKSIWMILLEIKFHFT